MLIGITNAEEIAKCISDLKRLMEQHADVHIPIMYSSRANTRPELNASYSKKLNLWWSIALRENRYWNVFGKGKPHENKINRGRCQINVPIEGFNGRISGGFARDSNGNIYIIHNGGVGGGMTGISRSSFTKWYIGNREDVIYDERVEKYFVIGEFSSPNFIEQVNFFVKKVYEFKEDDPVNVINELRMLENGESLLQSPYVLPERVVYRGVNHAIVVNELLHLIKRHTALAYRNRFMDSFIVDKKGICTHIFEVKCQLSTQSLYTGIGQLLIYGLNHSRAKRYLVIEEKHVEQVCEDLKRMNIHCISYTWKNKRPVIQFGSVLDDIS